VNNIYILLKLNNKSIYILFNNDKKIFFNKNFKIYFIIDIMKLNNNLYLFIYLKKRKKRTK